VARRQLLDHSAHATRLAAALIQAAPADVAVTCNVTAALSAIVACECRRIRLLGNNSVMMYTDVGYGSVKLMIADSACPSVLCAIPFPPPSPAAILAAITSCIHSQALAGAPVATIVIDHVTSNSALLMPVADVARLAALHSITVVVDAAHALGAINVAVPQLGVHYWVSNCHKWLCAPKGSGVLWVAPSHQQRLRPVVVSHAHHHGLSSAFVWDGCRDYGSLLALPAVIAQWRVLNRSGACDAYRRSLLDAAVSLCAREWNSAWCTPPEMRGPMALVELPQRVAERFTACGAAVDANAAASVQNALHRSFNVEAPVKCLHGRLFVRLSAHIYNTLQHYRSVADAVSCYAAQGQGQGQGQGLGQGQGQGQGAAHPAPAKESDQTKSTSDSSATPPPPALVSRAAGSAAAEDRVHEATDAKRQKKDYQEQAASCAAPQYSHTSHLTPHTSHLTPHTSHLTPHTSHLTPHTSHLTPHTSHLTIRVSVSPSCSCGG
jgi:selenocysteine lyase/cysteine desulfurase